MKKYLLAAASAVVLTVPAFAAGGVTVEADEITVQDGMNCKTTVNGNQKTVICKSEGQGTPDGHGPHVVIVPPPGGGNDDVNVQVFKNGDKEERRVVIVRRMGMDEADENKDGKISRKEFLARAEKHFGELDRDHNGVLEKDEMHPPMPPLPPGVPMPPEAPMPPAPPAPPKN